MKPIIEPNDLPDWLAALENECYQSERDLLDAKEKAKAARGAYQEAVARLRAAIREKIPLFGE